ncbi:DUF6318 family protein [Terrabacter aeriphilus]|uniref:DUF6318 family protein n=1 Tax=Terrabacter aeriphilus TaxID=515662 RepID=UPI0031EBAD81
MTAVTPHRTRPVRRVGGLRLVGMVAMVAVTGCTGGGATPPASSTAAPPSTTSSTSSATTTSTPAPPSTSTTPPTTPTAGPAIPAAARARTQSGAEAFAAYYLRQVDRAFTTGSIEPLRGLSGPGCTICEAFISSTRELAGKGWHHEPPSLSVKSAAANSFSRQKSAVVVFVRQNSVAIVDRSGKKVDQTKSGDGAFLASMTYTDRWVMARLQVVK